MIRVRRVTPACLPQREVGGITEIDDVLEVKSDPFSTMTRLSRKRDPQRDLSPKVTRLDWRLSRSQDTL